ncbi:MAG TPA: ArgR family transcriptional regulator [Blastocatellia bacterium]|nr:ArgR family transcriptional regulator [Blastocatellia bacterium]
MKKQRQDQIARIIASANISTQQELARELARHGVGATQSSVSRDIEEMGLVKLNGFYTLPSAAMRPEIPRISLDIAGDNLIVAKTEVGQAQPVAVMIDRAEIAEIVGTLAGDDTILIAVKAASHQRTAIGKLKKLFPTLAQQSNGAGRSEASRKSRSIARALSR